MYAGGKARRCQRSRQEIAVMDRQPDIFSVADIEIGVRYAKGFRLSGGRTAKNVDIMVAVALGGGDADQRAERGGLLHAEAGPPGQGLAGGGKIFASPPPLPGTGRI